MPRPTITNRRTRILSEARELLLTDGFKSMAMSTLAERIGIGTGALYLEFASKSELVEVLLKDGTRSMALEVAKRLSSGEHDSRRLSDVYRVGAEVLLDDPFYTAAFLDPDAVLGDVVSSAQPARYREVYDGFRDYLQELWRMGLLDPEIDLDGLALTLSSYTIGLLSIAQTIGPLTVDDLRSSLKTMAGMVSSLERLPGNAPGHAPDSYSQLLERLDGEGPQ